MSWSQVDLGGIAKSLRVGVIQMDSQDQKDIDMRLGKSLSPRGTARAWLLILGEPF